MPQKRPLILLTNDDGYFADGLQALERALARQARLVTVAPDREQSASSHSLTLNRPLRLHERSTNRFVVDGTPTDCVMLAVHAVLKKKKPDMIISGINHGANMGDDVTYSGTIAAAIEGAILNIPSIAVSMANYEPDMPMDRAAQFIAASLPLFTSLGLGKSSFLNINFPPDSGKPYRAFRFTSQGFRRFADLVVKKTDPRGRDYYWIAGRPTWSLRPGTDYEAVAERAVSITPMKLDFTDHPALERLRSFGKGKAIQRKNPSKTA